eukprot:2535464-Prymnesium_polylepis.1
MLRWRCAAERRVGEGVPVLPPPLWPAAVPAHPRQTVASRTALVVVCASALQNLRVRPRLPASSARRMGRHSLLQPLSRGSKPAVHSASAASSNQRLSRAKRASLCWMTSQFACTTHATSLRANDG